MTSPDQTPAFTSDTVTLPGLTYQDMLDLMASIDNARWIGDRTPTPMLGLKDTSAYAVYAASGHYPIPDSVLAEIDRLTGHQWTGPM